MLMAVCESYILFFTSAWGNSLTFVA